jgi:hypothetical protein
MSEKTNYFQNYSINDTINKSIVEDISKINYELLKSQSYNFSTIFKILDYKEKKLEQINNLNYLDKKNKKENVINENKRYNYKNKILYI